MAVTSVTRTVRVCRWSARVNPLWLWCYCGVVLAADGYLLYRAVTRCREYNELPWQTHDKPVAELYVYIALIVISVMCMPFFVITCIFQVGNYANDGVRLGRDNVHEEELLEYAAHAAAVAVAAGEEGEDGATVRAVPEPPGGGEGCSGRLQTLWRHIGPLSHGFHLVSSFALLLPAVLVDAQKIKYGFTASPDVLWRSDLDILFGRHLITSGSAIIGKYDNMTGSSAALPSMRTTLLPPEMEFRRDVATSPEFVSVLVALVMFGVRHAAVFWYTKMTFSLLFAALWVVATVHGGFVYCGMAVLYKFTVNVRAVPGLSLLLPPTVTLVLYLLGSLVVFFAPLTVFYYGNQHYNERWLSFLRTVAPSYARSKKSTACCHGYVPHSLATLCLLLFLALRVPIIYDSVRLYQTTSLQLPLASVVADGVFLLTWVALWFVLTVKQRWGFQLMFGRYMSPHEPREEGEGRRRRRGRGRDGAPGEGSSGEAGTGGSLEDSPPLLSIQPAHTANGHAVLVVDTASDDVDGDPPLSPTGVLRKSKSDKRNGSQRVKFDDSVPHPQPGRQQPEPLEGTDASAPPPYRHSQRERPGEEWGGAPPGEGPMRRAYSDSSGRRRGGSRSGDDSTPENTLTRSYRFSIRDKCGQYYHDPPPAQSSPVPERRRPELSLNPQNLEADAAYGPPPDLSPRAHPSVVLRTPPGGDMPGKRSSDSRFSYPPSSPEVVHDSPQRPQRHSMYMDYTPHPAASQSKHRTHMPSQSEPMTQTPRGVSQSPRPDWLEQSRYKISNDPHGKPPVIPPKGRPPLDHSYNRDLRVMSNKPELTRRDSALPSSNDTSSNDSGEQILCSQV